MAAMHVQYMLQNSLIEAAWFESYSKQTLTENPAGKFERFWKVWNLIILNMDVLNSHIN